MRTSFNSYAVDPNLRVPFTMQWNAAIERELGAKQTLTATYVGSDANGFCGRMISTPPLISEAWHSRVVSTLIRNAGYSHYNALQVQFQRRMSHGLQALVSYNFQNQAISVLLIERSVSATSLSDIVLPPLTPSDFDIRQSIAGAVSYEVPAPSWGRVATRILKGWAVDGLVRVSSAPPINVTIDRLLGGVWLLPHSG